MNKRLIASLGGVAAALALAGCASMVPRYERPAAPVPAAFAGDVGAAPGGMLASDIAWQSFFTDERLKRLIAVALQNNRDLRVAVLNIEQVRAQYLLRRADEWPTVNAGTSASRQPSSGGSISSTYTAGLLVNGYELDFFGRVRSLGEAAAAQLLGSEEARKTVQIVLISSVATTYFNLLADDELLAVTTQALTTREESLRLSKLRFDNGATSELNYRQAESLLEAARVSLAQLTRQRAQDENALALLLGGPLPPDLPPATAFAARAAGPDLPAGLPSEVLTRRPDVRQAEQTLIAANANIGAARAAFFPRITLTGSAGLASSELTGLFKSGAFAWSFAPQLLLPIFDAGRNQAHLDLAQISRDIAVVQYEKAVQTAFREVADALAGRATLGEQLRAQQAQANAEAVRFKLADLRYRVGASSYLDVLDAQRSLLNAQQAVVQVQALQVQNQVALYRVLGGGWAAEEVRR